MDQALLTHAWGAAGESGDSWLEADYVCYFVTFIVHLLLYFEIVSNLFNCISQLYIPLNIVDWHWVLARVDIRNRHVDIYDSLLNAGTNRQEFEAIWVMMPYILRDSNVYNTKPSLDRSLNKFTHKYITSLPQQNNGYVY